MAKVKINNKMYDVPQLGFAHMQTLESEGISIVDMFRKRQVFSIATAMVIICTGLPVEEANKLVEQHILGGGKLNALHEAFAKATEESAFFKKLLEEEADGEKTEK